MTTVVAQLSRPLFEPSWVPENLGEILDALRNHLVLTGVSVGVGLVLSLLVATLVLQVPQLYEPALSFFGVLFTVPSLAAFALLVPLFGFSATAAIIALTSYTLLILVKNLVDGINGVPDDVVEAARAMGYRPLRLLLTVQLPLALPVIIAGIRIATVTVIGLVTVTAVIGQNSLGQLILQGFRTLPPFPTRIVVGTVLSIVIAVILDIALLGLERLLTPWARRRARA